MFARALPLARLGLLLRVLSLVHVRPAEEIVYHKLMGRPTAEGRRALLRKNQDEGVSWLAGWLAGWLARRQAG